MNRCVPYKGFLHTQSRFSARGFFAVLALSLFLAPLGLTAQESTPPATDPAAAAPAAAAPAPANAAAPAAGGGDAAAIAQGKAVFDGNCKQCHAFGKVVVGPDLTGAIGRWPSEAALVAFIKYPQKTIDGGNAYAKGLYEKYKQYMPNHDFLKDDEVKSLIAYIKNPPVEAAPATAAAGDGKTAEAGASADADSINLVLGLLLVVLVIVMLVLVLIISLLNKAVANSAEIPQEEKEFLSQKADIGGFMKSSAFRSIVIIAFILIAGKVGYDKVYAIGIQQGYAPRQPIAFSHKLHAGMYQIECQYCHTGVERWKSATIPSVNICMNCHNTVKTESEEIKKLWSAVQRNKPIEWVRVHNLPDLAYFNHAQHVKVGGVQCQTCHGAIQEMEVVQQHSSLTMGWCINCHRQTVVKAEGNGYYDKLVFLHKQVKKGDMKVADIGGLECSKCHY